MTQPRKIKSALITGGAGFIGSHLAESLLADGVEVHVLDDLSTGNLKNINHLLDQPGFQFHLGSVMDADLCNTLVSKVQLVFHLAAAVGVQLIFTQPLESIERNIRGTENVLAACLRNGRKVFIASTSEVYGKDTGADGEKFHEGDSITLGYSMRWCYACSKAMDEYLARAYHSSKGLPVVIGRLFNTVGPRQSPAYGMVIPRFVASALSHQAISVYGDGLQKRTFNHVLDTVRGIRGLMEHPAAEGDVFNIGGQEIISILDLAKRIKSMTQSRSEIKLVPYEQAFGPGFEDIRNRVPDISKINRVIAYSPRHSLEDVLRDTIKAMS